MSYETKPLAQPAGFWGITTPGGKYGVATSPEDIGKAVFPIVILIVVGVLIYFAIKYL